MYASPTYSGYNTPAGQNANNQSSFNPNGASQQQNPHLSQQQQQQPGQAQQLMYNSQFAAGSPSPYGASPGNGMGPGVGGGGMGTMQQNNGMAQMAGSHVSQYQTPYSGSAYANVPVSAGLPPNFMPTTNAPSFPMNATSMNMTPQQMQQMQHMQRMQPPPSSTSTQPGPRASPFAHSNNTPPNAGTQQSAFPTPQNASQTPGPQASNATVVTPQTPNFPSGAQNVGGMMATPLSPGSEAKEKERVTLLLEINRELLLEVMALQAAQAGAKKEELSPGVSSPDESDKDKTEKEKADKVKAISGREYIECMRRLQANLAYLAAIADRSHKPSSQIPTHPAIMAAPPLMPRPQPTSAASTPASESKKDESEEKDVVEDREARVETLKMQYKKLQDLFPGVDPKKDPTAQPSNTQPAQKPQPGPGQVVDPNALQKLQNDQLRQKMMQQAQAQQNQNQGQMLGR